MGRGEGQGRRSHQEDRRTDQTIQLPLRAPRPDHHRGRHQSLPSPFRRGSGRHRPQQVSPHILHFYLYVIHHRSIVLETQRI